LCKKLIEENKKNKNRSLKNKFSKIHHKNDFNFITDPFFRD